MKLLITGCGGQLGTELVRQLKDGKSSLGNIPEQYINADVTAVDIAELDLTDQAAVDKFITDSKFDIIFNCAAYTNVDACETQTEAAYAVNALAPKYLAAAAEKIGAKLIHVSTDYVFAGNEPMPRVETDEVAPVTAYGKTKLEGEKFVKAECSKYFICRTAWLYGLNGKNFVKTILRIAKERGGCSVVNDQFGNPTSCVDLAHTMLKLAVTDNYGIYHCTCSGICSWFDFAKEFVRLAGIDVEVKPCTTAEYASKTQRPAYSALDNAALRATVGDDMRDWRAAIAEYINELKETNRI